MAADVLLLTALLYFTGGPFNPFNFLYLVHIALAAVVLRSALHLGAGRAVVRCASARCSSSRAFRTHAHAHAGHGGRRALHAHTDMRMHLYGMWVAFGVAAVVHRSTSCTRVTRDLARREQELAEARALAARSEQLASLATLAAGAAHELSTPLSTIAVVAKELERELARGDSRPRRTARTRG